jgi:hypothetical protein
MPKEFSDLSFWISIAIAIGVADAAGKAYGDSLGFWPMLGIRIVAGGTATLAFYSLQKRFTRRNR